VQRGEFEWAHVRNERIQASYLPHNFDPVMGAGRFELWTAMSRSCRASGCCRRPGHTPHHQSVLVRSAGETACFLADVIPTSRTCRCRGSWATTSSRSSRWRRSARCSRAREEEQWLLVFEHDPGRRVGPARSASAGPWRRR
jgi:hypothetical protein